MIMSSQPVTFVLVHGGNPGAWVWDLVLPHLEKPGLENGGDR